MVDAITWRCALRFLFVLCAAHQPGARSSYVAPAKYLIISNARNGSIGYVKISPSMNDSKVTILVDKGLGHPQGIAVDQKRQLLLVADSSLRKVVSYGLTLSSDGSLMVDEQTPLAENVESRWVTVDGPGNVYFSDEPGNRLMRITAAQVYDGDTLAQTVLPPLLKTQEEISAPGGVASDNFYLYWANKVDGNKFGTVVRSLGPGPNRSEEALNLSTTKLASNEAKAYGVCIAIDKVYFTAPEKNLYGVKTTGGAVTTIASNLRNPRGCTWDGDSTIYVADRTANGVYAFPGPAVSLVETKADTFVHFEDAFGVAVFSSAWRGWRSPAVAWALLLPLLVATAGTA